MTEDEVVLKAQKGDNEATNEILTRYKHLVSAICKRYFLINAENDDLVQEGMIGLFSAVRTYKPSLDVPFKKYAKVCITRQIMDALKANNRQKNQMLNAYFSINNQGKIILSTLDDEQDEDNSAGFFLVASNLTPEESLIFHEKLKEFNKQINKELSDMEKQVLRLYVSGMNYTEIAQKLQKDSKSIDNALSRIKIKLKDLKGE